MMAKSDSDTTTGEADKTADASVAAPSADRAQAPQKDAAQKTQEPQKAASAKTQAPAAADVTAAPEPEAVPEITLHQFLRISGVAQDQSAGFVRYAQKAMAGRYRVETWKQALSDFWKSPAR